jgi:hypothetical protein
LDELKVFIPPPIQSIIVKLALSQRGTHAIAVWPPRSNSSEHIHLHPLSHRQFLRRANYLFVADIQSRLRAYRFAMDGGGMPAERVGEIKNFKQPRGMAFHRATGTLLITCTNAYNSNAMAGVELLDTRPPPAQVSW